MAALVSDYFDLLDVHGSFAFAWTQAAQEDEEIRVAGMKRHLAICGQIGDLSWRRAPAAPRIDRCCSASPSSSLLERSWNYGQLYADTVDRDALIAETARALFAMARAPAADSTTDMAIAHFELQPGADTGSLRVAAVAAAAHAGGHAAGRRRPRRRRRRHGVGHGPSDHLGHGAVPVVRGRVRNRSTST